MRKAAVGVVAVLFVGGAMVLAQGGAGRQGGEVRGGGTTIVEKAPTDRGIAIPKEKLNQYLKDMDAKKLQTLRMIEGGKFNVNIRRITNAETALIHPNTIDTWVVIDGGGTLTTGGKLEKGKILNGVTNQLKVGDVVFIPSGLPHGVSGVNGNITWLNIRWDTDYPADAPLRAGRAPAPAAPAGRGGMAPLEYASKDRAVYISKEKLDGYLRDMNAKNSGVLRMVEGGHFNVNIRRQPTPSGEIHPETIDIWVILQGSGTVATGFTEKDNTIVPGTGVTAPAKVGDVFFIPANVTHGPSGVKETLYWLNVRWDVNWAAR